MKCSQNFFGIIAQAIQDVIWQYLQISHWKCSHIGKALNQRIQAQMQILLISNSWKGPFDFLKLLQKCIWCFSAKQHEELLDRFLFIFKQFLYRQDKMLCLQHVLLLQWLQHRFSKFSLQWTLLFHKYNSLDLSYVYIPWAKNISLSFQRKFLNDCFVKMTSLAWNLSKHFSTQFENLFCRKQVA